jgi:hypothetical protein
MELTKEQVTIVKLGLKFPNGSANREALEILESATPAKSETAVLIDELRSIRHVLETASGNWIYPVDGKPETWPTRREDGMSEAVLIATDSNRIPTIGFFVANVTAPPFWARFEGGRLPKDDVYAWCELPAKPEKPANR